MTNQTHIYSFDELKRNRAGRSRVRSSQANEDWFEIPDASQSEHIDFAALGAARRSGVPFDYAQSAVGTSGNTARNSRSTLRAERSERFERSERPAHSVRSQEHTRAQRQQQNIHEVEEQEACARKKKSRRDELAERINAQKRARAKERAGKQFSAQFAQDAAQAVSEGPRAAVYKGEMGASQRKATKMQNHSSARQSKATKVPTGNNSASFGTAARGAAAFTFGAFGSAGTARKTSRAQSYAKFEQAAHTGDRVRFSGVKLPLPKLGFLQKINPSSRVFRVGLVAVCLAALCVFMYPAAQSYYVGIRNNDKLEAEYAAILERNALLEQTVANLESDEGIKQMARDNYGWVSEGENGVTVYGLDNTQAGNSALYGAVPAVKAPETWYSVILDPLFGVE